MRILRQILVQDPMSLAWPVVVFAAIFAAGWLTRRLVLRALRGWSARTQSRTGTILADAIKGPALIWTVILGAHIAIQTSDLPARLTDRSAEVLYLLWMLSLTLVGAQLAGKLVRRYGEQVPGALPVTTLSQNLVQIAVVILGVVVVVDHYGRSVTPILTALGVGGLAVALALQDTLSNLFGGFYVAIARQIRLGDYIKLDSGGEGYVTDIGWRSTTIETLTKNIIIVPNAKLAQAIVTNYSLPDKRLATSLQVGVSYDSDPDRVEAVLLELAIETARELQGMLEDPPPTVTLDPGFGDSAVDYTIAFQVAAFADQFAVRNELRRRILRRFRQEGINIPFPTRTVRLEGREPAV